MALKVKIYNLFSSRIFCLILSLESSSCAILAVPNIWSGANPMFRTSALDTTGLQLENLLFIQSCYSNFCRAPELIFGATDYTTNIDVWSAGCVFAELMLGQVGVNGCDRSPWMSATSSQHLRLNRSHWIFSSRFSLVIAEWTSLWKSSRYCFYLPINFSQNLDPRCWAPPLESRSRRWTPTTQSSSSPRSKPTPGQRWVSANFEDLSQCLSWRCSVLGPLQKP